MQSNVPLAIATILKVKLLIGTSHFSEMKRDIRMANYEKRGKQEAAYPSLLPVPHCLVTVIV